MRFLRPFLFAFAVAACARGADLQVVHGWPQLPAGEILGQVAGIGCDSRGDVFVFHRGSRPWLEDPAMGRPYGVRIGKDGRLYVADGGEQPSAPPNRSGLAVLTLEGKVVATFGRWGNYAGQFMMAHDIALSSGGDINGRRIQKLQWTNAH